MELFNTFLGIYSCLLLLRLLGLINKRIELLGYEAVYICKSTVRSTFLPPAV